MGKQRPDWLRIRFKGSSQIGVFLRCSEDWILYPPNASQLGSKLAQVLKAHPKETTLCGSELIGCFGCGNSRGMLLPSTILRSEFQDLSRDLELKILDLKFNALGNLILVNDSAALVSPLIPPDKLRIISRFLDVEVAQGTLAGMNCVGMAGIATNRGLIVHPGILDHELELIQDLFKLPVTMATVNSGSGMVGAGLVANTKGYVIGEDTTGVEQGRIEEALFLDE